MTFFDPTSIVPKFDEFLDKRGLKFAGIAVGGGALNLLGTVTRTTRDIDFIVEEIPAAILVAAEKFATQHGLSADWFNAGPKDLRNDLPHGWQNLVVKLFYGKALTLDTLCRLDHIRTKFWAFCDRQRDRNDLLSLAPTPDELKMARIWARERDGNPNWPEYVDKMAAELAKELGHG